jgi:hypothetical protein
MLLLGAGAELAGPLDVLLPSIRVSRTANRLPLATAAAILLDRLIGEA